MNANGRSRLPTSAGQTVERLMSAGVHECERRSRLPLHPRPRLEAPRRYDDA